jgi:hypothetical protein
VSSALGHVLKMDQFRILHAASKFRKTNNEFAFPPKRAL